MNTREVEVGDLGPLTPREAEALLWIARGKTSWEAGRIMGVSESTVVAHTKASMSKLNAATRPHLVACAFVCGILRVGILRAGTTFVLILAILIRMPGTAYPPMHRARIRRRDEDVPELLVEVERRTALRTGTGIGPQRREIPRP